MAIANGFSPATIACFSRSKTRPPNCWPATCASVCSRSYADNTTLLLRYCVPRLKRISGNRRGMSGKELDPNFQGRQSASAGGRETTNGIRIMPDSFVPQDDAVVRSQETHAQHK